MNRQELVDLVRSQLGTPPDGWYGADSTVWKVGGYVIKAMFVRIDLWRNMRLLSRREGPFAPILDMRVVGAKTTPYGTYIVGLMVQPYVNMPRPREKYDGLPHDVNYNDVPEVWDDGIDVWWQLDGTLTNAVDGVWVDVVSIEPLQAKKASTDIDYSRHSSQRRGAIAA